MRCIFYITLNRRTIVKYNVWNHDVMLESQEIFFKISFSFMLVIKSFLYFCHNLTNWTKRIYQEVNNHAIIRIRKLYSCKGDKQRGWAGNKFYLINKKNDGYKSLAIKIFTVQRFCDYLGKLLALNIVTRCIERIKYDKNSTV